MSFCRVLWIRALLLILLGSVFGVYLYPSLLLALSLRKAERRQRRRHWETNRCEDCLRLRLQRRRKEMNRGPRPSG
ncbi:hypothetical protein CHARACLAT_022534 [Characodon lateralis]|uniref:Transmembrane protein n=1 Tax=Characodon lateralis TaxID=208331 RepID=A0ABU7DLW6_9TELE|nr:hypothetical protein [Characodon lateralis]